MRIAFTVFVIKAFPIQFMMDAVNVRQLMQEDMKQLNRMGKAFMTNTVKAMRNPTRKTA